jgi:hypothetical protein
MRELYCLNSGIVSVPARSNSSIVQPDSRTCVLEIPVLQELSIVP